jgi:hypothetical protein
MDGAVEVQDYRDVRPTPSPEATIAIITGASEWPGLGFERLNAFVTSANLLKRYLLGSFKLPERNLLWLFDEKLDATQTLVRVGEFIDERRKNVQFHDLMFWYIGHGDFLDNNEFFMPIHATLKGHEYTSALIGKDLANVLQKHARFHRQYIVLDCCYSAGAVGRFQNPAGTKIAANQLLDNLPVSGVTMLCSSSARVASVLLNDGSQTMFSSAVLGALAKGISNGAERLSFADIQNLAAQIIRDRWPDKLIIPELHSPRQDKGKDLRNLPFFPNPGRLAPVAAPTNVGSRWAVAAALEQKLQRCLSEITDRSNDCMTTYAVRIRIADSVAAIPNGSGAADSDPRADINVCVLVLHREDFLRAIDRLVRVADEEKIFGVSNFIKMGLRRVDLFPDQAGSLSADLARRVEHVLRSATADLERDKRPPIIPHEGGSPGEWPGIRLQIGLVSPPLSVNEPVRVQIEFRSMFDDVISEVHRELRSFLKPGRAAQSAHFLRQAETHLNALRQMFGGCSGYVDAIRRYLGEALGGNLDMGQSTPSMGSPEQVREFLRRAGVRAPLVNELMAIIEKPRYYDIPETALTEVQTNNLLKDAEALHVLFARESKEDGYLTKERQGHRAFRYIVRMDEALLRVQTNRPDSLAVAVDIYEELEILFPLKPTIRYRLGWALGKQGQHSKALEKYKAALSLIDEAMGLDEREREIRVPWHEIDVMRRCLPRFIGYQYWKIAEECGAKDDTSGQLANLVQAYQATQAGLGQADINAEESNHNNLLYYAVEYLRVMRGQTTGGGVFSPQEITDRDLETHLDYLRPRIIVKTSDKEGRLDTLRHAYCFLERFSEAVQVSQRIIQLLLSERPLPPHGLDNRASRILKDAHAVVSKYSA